MPADHDLDDQDLADPLVEFTLEDADVCSAPTSLATLRSAPGVPAKEGRRKADASVQPTVTCAVRPSGACKEGPEEDEGPDTPASAEKHASVIIRCDCTSAKAVS